MHPYLYQNSILKSLFKHFYKFKKVNKDFLFVQYRYLLNNQTFMSESYIQWIFGNLIDSQNLSVLLNHLVQVYCFTYGILCLLTTILTMTNFIYADYILKIKPIGIASFVLFWSMKLWTSFDSWMIWINVGVGIYIAFYFYDACCNVSDNLNSVQEDTNKYGAILIIVNIALAVGVVLVKEKGKQSDARDNFTYIGLVVNLFLINLYRMRERSLFPSLVVILIMNFTLLAKRLLLLKGFTKNIPFEALIYLLFIIDAEGREFIKIQNKVIHHLFLTCVYFYGFVITNQRHFHAEYIFLGVAIFMLVLNK